jgi:hypothetical protein
VPDVKLEIETRRFDACISQLALKLGTNSYRAAMYGEIGKVLQAAAERTKKATARSIAENNPKPGVPWVNAVRWGTVAGKKYRWDWKLKNDRWKLWNQMHAEKVAKLKAKAGLAQSIFVEIAKKLGLAIRGTTASNAVKTSTVNPASLASVAVEDGKDKLVVVIEDLSNYARRCGADQALYSAIHGRVKFFERNLAEGVFRDAKQIAAKYPGIEVTQRTL